MKKVTQQNAANAEESASASEELSAQAESVNEIVGQLMTLVGDVASKARHSRGRSKTYQPTVSTPREESSREHRRLPAKTIHFGQSDEAFHKIATKAEHGRPTGASKAANSVIPLSRDEDDLTSFNS